jgi:hypothetical protein
MLVDQITELLHANTTIMGNSDKEEENIRYEMFRPLLTPYMA